MVPPTICVILSFLSMVFRNPLPLMVISFPPSTEPLVLDSDEIDKAEDISLKLWLSPIILVIVAAAVRPRPYLILHFTFRMDILRCLLAIAL